jgi:hypothetical protein
MRGGGAGGQGVWAEVEEATEALAVDAGYLLRFVLFNRPRLQCIKSYLYLNAVDDNIL